MIIIRRNRILRQSAAVRSLVAETSLSPNDFIVLLFILEGENNREEMSSMPGYYRMSLDHTLKEVKDLWRMGLKSVLLFIKCKDELKDNQGTEALNRDGLMQKSIREITNACP